MASLADNPDRLRDPYVRAILHNVDTDGLRSMMLAVAKQEMAAVPGIEVSVSEYRAAVTHLVLTGEINVDQGQELTELVEAILREEACRRST
jgi:hypothetical protein